MLPYHFPGAVHFVERAAADLGRPVLAGAVRHLAALSSLASLCAQAVHAEASQAATILAEAAAFRDQLHAAALAADLILDDVRNGLGLSEEPQAIEPASTEVDAVKPVAPAVTPVAAKLRTGRAARRRT
jgi:hypothetical protein